MNFTYEFTLKEGPKIKMKFFIGTKSWRKILEGLKRKISIFIGTNNLFNPFFCQLKNLVFHFNYYKYVIFFILVMTLINIKEFYTYNATSFNKLKARLSVNKNFFCF